MFSSKARVPALLALLLAPLRGAGPDLARATPQSLRGPSLQALADQGMELMTKGNPKAAAEVWAQLIQRRPENPMPYYNLACCFSALGQAEAAARFVEEAFRLGLRDLEAIRRDTDLAQVRASRPFQAALERMKAAAAQDPEGLRVAALAQSIQQVRLLPPAAPAPGKRHPLLVFLHGSGGSPESLLDWARAFTAQGFFVLLPQGQYPMAAGAPGHMYFPVLQGPECLVPAPRELELAESTILAALDGALATQPVDPRKVFVAGFSQGGLMALALALRHPERFRGCAPVGGWLPPSFAAPAPAGSALPSILVCHSPQDPLIPSPLQEGTLKVLEKAGARAEAFDYEGGHRITGPVVARVVRWCAEKAGD